MNKILLLGVALFFAGSAQAGLYKWVDDNGKIHFSDKVPAAASKKSHTKLNKSGDVTVQIDPAEKQKKLDIKLAKQKEKERLAKIQRQKADAQAEIQKRDNNLLSIYENEDELISYFTNKIKMVEGNSKILEAQNGVLHKKVMHLEERVSKTKHDERRKNISKKIVDINKTIDQYKKALLENEKQIIQLTTNYQTNLFRFRELTK